jgi:hypothetical protein
MMATRSRAAALLLLLAIAWRALGAAQPEKAPPEATLGQPGPAPQLLADLWDREHVSWPVPPLVRHADVEARLREVQQATPDLFSLEPIGRSVEARSINHLWFGRGRFHVLLWSQMHGDEPTATAALFDLFEYVRRHRQDPPVQRMLDALTLHVVPMLNPDGAERYQRRNAQGIDINRDALRMQTPEGQTLKALRDRLDPTIGFNLHNQNWRTSAGKTGQPATISLLSVAFDEPRTESPGRLLTKKTCAVIRDALEVLAPGRVARYDDEFEVRAFGDNLTKWGTSVVLIETGPWPSAEPDSYLVRLNFVAIVTALDALGTGRVHQADKSRYESLPINESDLFYLLIRNATVNPGTGVAPFTADVGIVASRVVRQPDGQRRTQLAARIEDLGDLHTMSALESLDATGLTVAPLYDGQLKVGDVVTLPDWKSARAQRVVAPGEPAELLLLRPQSSGRYRVERIIKY